MRPHRAPAVVRSAGLTAILLLALGSTGAAPVTRPAATGGVEGFVRDGAGQPIPGARVSVAETALGAAVDSTGHYLISAVPAGRNHLRAEAPGYHPTEVEVTVRAGTTVRRDLVLSPAPQPLAEMAKASGQVSRRNELDRADAPLAARAATAPRPRQNEEWNTEAYARIEENRFLGASANPVSTFSIDVDAASYSNVRRFLAQGTLPPADAVRLEEMVNYFPYRYPDRAGEHPFGVIADVGPCPWADDHRLVRVALQARRVDTRELPPSNLVFLIDVSGSMQSPAKLPLVKRAFRALVQKLRPDDRVAIVVYAGAAGLVLPSTPGSRKEEILDGIDRLEAGGSTAGGAGLRLAYDVAKEHFLPKGNNRVILATDGDFNVGVSSDAEMIRLVERRREEGTFLTVLGFGTGNLKDTKMEQMADHGNGHYAYIDSFSEARKVFVREFGGTLFTVAKDVKIQVEFNPARVQAYRLLGYENRLLAREDFADDRKDAGELGAGQSVTALYEVVPVGAEAVTLADDSLTYQHVSVRPSARGSSELLTLRVRYKSPTGSASRLLSRPLVDRGSRPGDDFRFASAVASFAMLLRDSEHRGDATFERVIALARGARGADPEGYRSEFVTLVETARDLSRPGDDEESSGPARVE
ncbi:MAG TPA: von Willebrand factor type A domain-containing protein [Gemmatimonadales bacterium]|nr:von Willebrand factor type A domain-containing protein [Gemmatimonadales bacterium]